MEADAGGQVDVEVGVVDLVQPPQQRHGMGDHMLQVDREVEDEEGEQALDPAWPRQHIEQAPAMRFGVGRGGESRGTDGQPLRDDVEHQHADVDPPARGARLHALAFRELPFRQRDESKDRQKYPEPDGRFHETSHCSTSAAPAAICLHDRSYSSDRRRVHIANIHKSGYNDPWTRSMPSRRSPLSARIPGWRCSGCWCAPERQACRPARSRRNLGTVQNTMSAHLKVLDHAGLVRAERDGRVVRYVADMTGIPRPARLSDGRLLQRRAGAVPAGHPGRHLQLLGGESSDERPEPINVLFLCTGNSARSILAEAILNRVGAGRFKAFSAGSHPKGEVHPYALQLLKSLNHDTSFARSKSWDEFAAPGAPEMDFVFTVCDNAANEACPVWPGQPMTAHWGVPDPAAVEGTEAEKHLAFADAYRMLNNRISIFISLPMQTLDQLALQQHLDEIGRKLPKAG